VGKGSTFWFEIKLGNVEQRYDYVSIGDTLVVVLEPNENLSLMFEKMLNKWSVEHIIVSNESDLILKLFEANLKTDKKIVIVLDGGEKIDYKSLINTIKSDLDRDIKTIRLHRLNDNTGIKKSQKHLYDYFISKPIIASDLLKLIVNKRNSEKEVVLSKKDFSKLHVLVVDDNTINQNVALAMLKKLDIYADAVANGLEAIGILKYKSYDMIIMDCQMPEMDGFDATQYIRERELLSIPIIAMTAYAQKSDIDRCFDVGMNDYLIKPLTQEGIESMIKKWIDFDKITEKENYTEAFIGKSIFNYNRLLEIFGDDKDGMKEIVEMVIEKMPIQMESINLAIRDNDVKTLKSVTHLIKGMLANVGAEAMMGVSTSMNDIVSESVITTELIYLNEILHQSFGELVSDFKNNSSLLD